MSDGGTNKATIVAAVIGAIATAAAAFIGLKAGQVQVNIDMDQQFSAEYSRGYVAGYADGKGSVSEGAAIQADNKSTPPPPTVAKQKSFLVNLTPTSKIGRIKMDNIPLIDCAGIQRQSVIWSNSTWDDKEYITYDVSNYSFFTMVLASPSTEEKMSSVSDVWIYLDGKEIEYKRATDSYGVKNPEEFRLNVSDGQSLKIVFANQYIEAYPRMVVYDPYLE